VVREEQSGIWANFVSAIDSIPEDSIAITVYILGSLIILWCWFGIAKRLPAPLGSITWIIIFAVLLTPTISAGPNSGLAPAIFGLIFGVLTKDTPLVWSNLSLIAFVVGLGFTTGYFWSKFRATNKTVQSGSVEKNTSPL
jgi:MFS superfamily sulfate permease-like transporter